MTVQPATSAAPRVDWGRTAVVPIFVVCLLANAASMVRLLGQADGGAARLASAAASLVTIASLALAVGCYLRRGPARATTASVPARVASVLATFLPLAVLPVSAGGTQSAGGDALSAATVVVGTSFSVWALRSLGKNLSIFAQTRELSDRGPYRWIRHPLYVGEVVATGGIALRAGSATALSWVVLLLLLQAYRAVHEERLLAVTLPGYAAYQRRTARLLPGVF